MRDSRRTFLHTLAGAAVFLAGSRGALLAQRRRPFPQPPQSSEKQNPADIAPPAPQPSKTILQQREREFRSGVERLYELASELREEVGKTTTSEVLSVGMYKKVEEIERLAKQLKAKAKG